MSMLVFWVVTPCGLVDRYQRFGETYPSSGLIQHDQIKEDEIGEA
jgi:hypothetical protein